MRIFSVFVLLVFLLVSCGNASLEEAFSEAEQTELIRLNQLGYFPELAKEFSLADSSAGLFVLVDEAGKAVFKSKMQDGGLWKPSGENIYTGDFSKFKRTGEYRVFVPGVGISHSFEISDELYSEAANAAMRTFYFMRASTEMDESLLGSYSRPMGHADDSVLYHASTGRTEGFLSSPGGWYDAGDYGKYIVNAAVSVGTMMALYELKVDVFPDGSLNIPESGNGVNDLLDELRYEYEWLLTMQDDDGGVFHKLTALSHDGITMPHKTPAQRYVIGKSTAATLDFAALNAQAFRAYESVDAAFASKCLHAAVKAYEWAKLHPDMHFSGNPKGVNTGAYPDVEVKEEFFWAAAELFSSTGNESYYVEIKDEIGNIEFRVEESWRQYVDNIGYYSLYMSPKVVGADRELLEYGILQLADQLKLEASASQYAIPITRFAWGSNSDILNTAIVELMAFEVSGDKEYLNSAVKIVDYVFGRNATAYSFVSGFGSKTPMNFHHRLLWADDNDAPFPGFIAGGPNFDRQDRGGLRDQGLDYPSEYPAKCYIDHVSSYASNEVCINWNAPLVFVLGYLDMLRVE